MTGKERGLFCFLLFCYIATSVEGVEGKAGCKDISALCGRFVRMREELGLTKTQTCFELWSRKYCKKTCGLCEKVVQCSSTPYGCCWDNVTPRSKTGECPVCRDIYKSFCPRFKFLCSKWSVNRDGLGARYRRSCPVTCDRCTDGQTVFKRRRFLLI